MRKIPGLYKRDYEGTRLVYDEIVSGCEWVLDSGVAIATAKYDGTAVMVLDGALYKRYDAENGKTPPDGFIPAQEPDEKTGHWPGWVAVNHHHPENKYHVEAFLADSYWFDGTYELVGPRINGNPHGFSAHLLVRHGARVLQDCPVEFNALRDYIHAINSADDTSQH